MPSFFAHNRWRAALMCLAAALSGAMPVFAQSPELKRLTLRNDLLGWEAVGRLDLAGQGFCTGTLVASDMVLTAAHCLFDSETNAAIPPDRIVFRAGLRDGEAVSERTGRRAVVHHNYDQTEVNGPNRVRHDLALLQLSQPISTTDANPFSVDSLDPDTTDVSVLSYAVGRSDAPSREGRCAVTGRTSGMIGFDCDVTFGSSGAPVFQRRDGRIRIVSVISSGARQGDRDISVGMELPTLYADMRSALRTGQGVWPQTSEIQTRRLSVSSDDRMESGARFLRP